MITGELSPDEGLTVLSKGKCWDIWLSTRSLTPMPPFMKRYEKSEPTFWNGSRRMGHGSGNEASLPAWLSRS